MKALLPAALGLLVVLAGCGGYGSSTLDRSTTGDPIGARNSTDRPGEGNPAAVFVSAAKTDAPLWVRVEAVRAVGAKGANDLIRPEEVGWIGLGDLVDAKGPRPRFVGLAGLPVADVVRVEVVVGSRGWLGPAPEDAKRSAEVRFAEMEEAVTLRLDRRRREADRTADSILVEFRPKLGSDKSATLTLAEGDARATRDPKRQVEARWSAKVEAISDEEGGQVWNLSRGGAAGLMAVMAKPKEAPAKVGDEVWIAGVWDARLRRISAREIAKRAPSSVPQSAESPDTSPGKAAPDGRATPAKP